MENQSFIISRNVSNLLKLLACIAVAICHYNGKCISHGAPLTLFRQIIGHGGSWGVAIFFFFSGYGLMESARTTMLKPLKYAKKRISKVYLPVVLSAIVFYLVGLCCKIDICSIHDTFMNIVLSCLWGWFDGLLWFINAILLLYVVIYIYFILDKKVNGVVSIGILLLFAIGSYLIINQQIGSWAARSIPAFYLGVITSRFNQKVFVWATKWKYILLTWTVLICSVVLFRHHGIVIHSFVDYSFLYLLLMICSKHTIKLWNVPQDISNASYDVYLVHGKVLLIGFALNANFPFYQFIIYTLLSAAAFYIFRINLVKGVTKTYNLLKSTVVNR